MQKYEEVIHQTIELSVTIKEAVDHLEMKMDSAEFTQTLGLMQDVLVGLESIKQSFQPIVWEVNKANVVEERVNEIKQQIDDVVTYIEKEEYNDAYRVVRSQIVVGIEQLQQKLNDVLNEHVSN